MILTPVLSLIFIAAICGALYAIVGLIQDKRLMTTAPKDIQEAARDTVSSGSTGKGRRSAS